jgi:hypothetical protein
MSYSYAECQAINAALQAGRKVASKSERTLTEAEFQEQEALAANCPVPLPLPVVRRTAKLRDELAGLLQTYLLPSKRAEAIRQLHQIELPRAKRANRSRPEELDEFLFSFVRFYVRLGGEPTKWSASYCARFIEAAAGRTLKEVGWDIKPTTVVNLIRARLEKNSVGMAADLMNPSPDIGAPTLGILPDDDV